MTRLLTWLLVGILYTAQANAAEQPTKQQTPEQSEKQPDEQQSPQRQASSGTSPTQTKSNQTGMAQDLLFYDNRFPVIIRIRPHFNGRPFEKPWQDYVHSLFKQIDSNQDGQWSKTELANVDSSQIERLTIAKHPELWQFDLEPFDQQLSLSEVEDFLIHQQRGPFQQFAPTGSVLSNSTVQLFDVMDRDGDRNLTPEEIRQSPRTLHRSDLNDDGSFSLNELQTSSGSMTRRTRTRTQRSNRVQLPFVLLGPGCDLNEICFQLTNRYADGNSQLSARLMGLPDVVFEKYDRDTSGDLDYNELRGFLRHPVPNVELRVNMANDASATDAIQIFANRDVQKKPGSELSDSPDNIVLRHAGPLASMVIGNTQIELTRSQASVESMRKYIVRQFKNADRDNNDYLEKDEVAGNRVFNAAFASLDADGDEKLFLKELELAVDAKIKIAATQINLAARNRGRNLFQILDKDRNSRLSPGEFTSALKRIDLWDGDKDNAIQPEEVPQVYQLTIGPGRPEFTGMTLPDFQSAASGPSISGPIWFQRMDRDSDNNLTRREFLGTRREFMRLDQDNNQAIDAMEAEEAVERLQENQ